MPNLIVTDTLPPYVLYKLSTDEAGALFLDQVETRDARRMLRDRQFDNVNYHFHNPNVGKFTSKVLGLRSMLMQGGYGYTVNTEDVFLLVTPLNNAIINDPNELMRMFQANEVIFQVVKIDWTVPQIDSVNLEYADDARLAVQQYNTTTVEETVEVENDDTVDRGRDDLIYGG